MFEIVDDRGDRRSSAVIEVLKMKSRHTIKAHRGITRITIGELTLATVAINNRVSGVIGECPSSSGVGNLIHYFSSINKSVRLA